MATYREFRQQTKRRRRKRAFRRALVFVLVVLIILGLAFAITKIIEGFTEKDRDPAAPGSSVSSDGTASSDAVLPDETPSSSQVLAPLPGAVDPTDMSWNTVGPVEQTLNYTIQTPDYRLIALPENGIVDIKYFDRTVLVGDSVSTGWSGNVYSSSPLKDHAFVCAYKNIGPNALVNKSVLDGRTIGRGEEVGYDTIVNSKPLRVYILLGANSLVRDGEAQEKSFLAYYGQLLDMFKADLPPEVKIYVEAITPVRPGVKQPGLYKERIMRVNNQLAAIAMEKGCYFLNIYDLLADENGDLREDYAAADGVHLKPDAYAAMAQYMMTHTVWDPSNPYLPGSPYYVAPAE